MRQFPIGTGKRCVHFFNGSMVQWFNGSWFNDCIRVFSGSPNKPPVSSQCGWWKHHSRLNADRRALFGLAAPASGRGGRAQIQRVVGCNRSHPWSASASCSASKPSRRMAFQDVSRIAGSTMHNTNRAITQARVRYERPGHPRPVVTVVTAITIHEGVTDRCPRKKRFGNIASPRADGARYGRPARL
jgi:hypothetical protein